MKSRTRQTKNDYAKQRSGMFSNRSDHNDTGGGYSQKDEYGRQLEMDRRRRRPPGFGLVSCKSRAESKPEAEVEEAEYCGKCDGAFGDTWHGWKGVLVMIHELAI